MRVSLSKSSVKRAIQRIKQGPHNLLARMIAQLVDFLQETNFYVVEEGRLSKRWQSPPPRRLTSGDVIRPTKAEHPSASNLGERKASTGGTPREDQPNSLTAVDGASRVAVETLRRIEYIGKGRSLAQLNGTNETRIESYERTRQQRQMVHDHKHGIQKSTQGHKTGALDYSQRRNVCPLIYSVDAHTAKEHGLHLFQVSICGNPWLCV